MAFSPLYTPENVRVVLDTVAANRNSAAWMADLATHMGITVEEVEAKYDTLIQREFDFIAAILNHNDE